MFSRLGSAVSLLIKSPTFAFVFLFMAMLLLLSGCTQRDVENVFEGQKRKCAT